MSRVARVDHQFVEFIPDELAPAATSPHPQTAQQIGVPPRRRQGGVFLVS